MKKWTKSLSWVMGAAAIVAPLSVTLSCGNSDNKGFSGIDIKKGITAGGGATQFGDNVIKASISKDATEKKNSWWGYEAQSPWLWQLVIAEKNNRLRDGEPMSTFRQSGDDLWNFRPGRVAHTEDELASAKGIEGKTKNGDVATVLDGDTPSVKDFWGDSVDQKFNRATVRDIAPRIFGEKLKDTQSTYANYYQMNPLTATDGNNRLGMLAGRKNLSNILTGNWNYAELQAVWAGGTKYPSGPEIDASHRNGVPILGTVYFSQRAWENPEFIRLMDPGSDGSYPQAKGLINVADYYGFDGWMFNWEGEPKQITPTKDVTIGGIDMKAGTSYDVKKFIEPFLKKWREYSDEPTNKNDPASLTEDQKNFHYYHKPQIISIYTGVTGQEFGDPDLSGTPEQFETKGVNSLKYSDYFTFVQGHGASPDATAQRAPQRFDWIVDPEINSDIYHANFGMNWPEDGQTDVMKATGTAYAVTQKHTAGSVPAIGEDGKTLGDRSKENQSSLWMYSYGNYDVKVDEKVYNSFVGDPRYEDKRDTTSASDLFQERTSITGHKNWTTTFDWGSGEAFNLWGGNNIASSLIGSNKTGWSNWEMQSFQPTYKWIVDEYDANGNATVDQRNLNLTSDGSAIARKINPITNNEAPDAWYGGTTVDYSGTLAKNESFTNKLFASAIKIENGDKFTIKVKNTDLVDNDKSEINLATWVKNSGDVDVPSNKTGFMTGPGVIRNGQTPWGTDLKAGAPIQNETLDRTMQYYQKDETWNFKRDKKIIKPESKKAIGTTGWTELTYDLSSLKDKTLVDFGINAKANEDKVDYAGLRLGEMHFEAKTNSKQDSMNMENFNTTDVWSLATEKTARVEWDAVFANAAGEEIDSDSTDNAIWSRAIDDASTIRQYVVYYADEGWNLKSVAWVGANTKAFLENMSPTADHQNIVVMAVDNNYKVVNQKSVVLDLGGK